MRKVVAVLSGLVVLLLVIGGIVLSRSITPEQVAHSLSPDNQRQAVHSGQSPLPTAQDFRVETVDRIHLNGWFIPARARLPQGSVVICHGVGANVLAGVGLAKMILELDTLNVVLFDFRGHGQSDAATFTYGARETRDVAAVVLWVRERTDSLPVSLVGWSAGASTALLYAAEDPHLAKVIAINPFTDLRSIALHRRPFFVPETTYKDGLSLVEKRLGFRLDEVSPLRSSARVVSPVLLIVSEDDTTIPSSQGRAISRRLNARSETLFLAGVDHDDWWRTAEFGPRVRKFLSGHTSN